MESFVELLIKISKQNDEKINELSLVMKKLDEERKKVNTELSMYKKLKEGQLLALLHLMPHRSRIIIDHHDYDDSEYYASYELKDGNTLRGSGETGELAQAAVLMQMTPSEIMQLVND